MTRFLKLLIFHIRRFWRLRKAYSGSPGMFLWDERGEIQNNPDWAIWHENNVKPFRAWEARELRRLGLRHLP